MLYQGKNPEKISKRRKKHYRENRDEILENKSKQYHENPEPKRKYNKQYYRTHKKEINAYSRLYGKEHRRELTKKHNLYIHDRRKSDPKFNIKRSMCRLVNHVIHGKRKQSLEKYLGYSIQTLLHHFDNGEFKVRDYLKGGYCIDHIIPKSLYEKDEIRLSFSYENLQIIPAKENIAKGNKLDWELVKKYDLYHLLPKKIKIQAESENRSDMVA